MKTPLQSTIAAALLLTSWAMADGGAYTVMKDEAGKYWFQAPDGTPFLSMGVNNITSQPFRPRPNSEFYAPVEKHFGGDRAAWLANVRETLRLAGLNTIGAWSNPDINDGTLWAMPILYIGGAEPDRCFQPLRPGFEDLVRANTRKTLAEHTAPAKIVGFFLDNEMPWFGKSAWDDLPNHTLLEAAMLLKPEDPARAAAVAFLRQRHDGDVAAFAKAWGVEAASWDALSFALLQGGATDAAAADRAEFTAMLAEKFYAIGARIVREEAPGKLVLGTRFAGIAPASVIEACGRHCDVMSVNDYRSAPRADAMRLARYYVLGGRPILITEYSWRGRENTSGNPNTAGAGSVVPTQKDRGDNYEKYVADLMAYPMVVGAHWFEFADQSPQGRFDGENSNYGIVDIDNRRYMPLIEAMARANARVADIHRSSTLVAPTGMPEPPKVTYTPGQHPGRPPVIDLLKEPAIGPPEAWKADDATMQGLPGLTSGSGWRFDTAAQWGCGLSFFGPRSLARTPGPPNTTDLDGYTTLVIELTATKGKRVEVFLDEAGVADGDYSAGDDGESFRFPIQTTTGERQSWSFELASALARETWGNQAGARRLDMQAMKGVAIYLPGGQGAGEIVIHSIRLER